MFKHKSDHDREHGDSADVQWEIVAHKLLEAHGREAPSSMRHLVNQQQTGEGDAYAARSASIAPDDERQ